MTDNFPDLRIEPLEPDNPQGTQVLTQRGATGCDEQCIHIHPLQVRHLAKLVGLLGPEQKAPAQEPDELSSKVSMLAVELRLDVVLKMAQDLAHKVQHSSRHVQTALPAQPGQATGACAAGEHTAKDGPRAPTPEGACTNPPG